MTFPSWANVVCHVTLKHPWARASFHWIWDQLSPFGNKIRPSYKISEITICIRSPQPCEFCKTCLWSTHFATVNSLLVKVDTLLSSNRLINIHRMKIPHCWLHTPCKPQCGGFKMHCFKNWQIFNISPSWCLLMYFFSFLVYHMKTPGGSETTAPSLFIKAINFVNLRCSFLKENEK